MIDTNAKVVSIGEYIKFDNGVNFYTLLEAASRKDETAIGYRKQNLAYSPKDSFGVKINPCKSDFIQFDQDDKLIVLAES